MDPINFGLFGELPEHRPGLLGVIQYRGTDWDPAVVWLDLP